MKTKKAKKAIAKRVVPLLEALFNHQVNRLVESKAGKMWHMRQTYLHISIYGDGCEDEEEGGESNAMRRPIDRVLEATISLLWRPDTDLPEERIVCQLAMHPRVCIGVCCYEGRYALYEMTTKRLLTPFVFTSYQFFISPRYLELMWDDKRIGVFLYDSKVVYLYHFILFDNLRELFCALLSPRTSPALRYVEAFYARTGYLESDWQ